MFFSDEFVGGLRKAMERRYIATPFYADGWLLFDTNRSGFSAVFVRMQERDPVIRVGNLPIKELLLSAGPEIIRPYSCLGIHRERWQRKYQPNIG
jgi:hypothetical protein